MARNTRELLEYRARKYLLGRSELSEKETRKLKMVIERSEDAFIDYLKNFGIEAPDKSKICRNWVELVLTCPEGITQARKIKNDWINKRAADELLATNPEIYAKLKGGEVV
jgi:hypothetical protein